jgi:hypothetical protein
MVRERDPRCLPAELRRYAAFDRLGRYQPNRPASAARRRRTADHRDDGRLLRAVEQRRRRWPRIVAQRVLQPVREIALADARSLSSKSADRFRGGRHSEAPIKQQQYPNAPPRSRAHPRATRLHLFESGAVLVREPQAGESRRSGHLNV